MSISKSFYGFTDLRLVSPAVLFGRFVDREVVSIELGTSQAMNPRIFRAVRANHVFAAKMFLDAKASAADNITERTYRPETQKEVVVGIRQSRYFVHATPRDDEGFCVGYRRTRLQFDWLPPRLLAIYRVVSILLHLSQAELPTSQADSIPQFCLSLGVVSKTWRL
jgi:hypothetical protein